MEAASEDRDNFFFLRELPLKVNFIGIFAFDAGSSALSFVFLGCLCLFFFFLFCVGILFLAFVVRFVLFCFVLFCFVLFRGW